MIRYITEAVSIPSENKPPGGNELPMQHYLQTELQKLGFACEMYTLSSVPGLKEHPAYWAGRDYDDRPNLLAVKRGRGGGRTLLFSVHSDVVPGIAGSIVENPFSPLVRDGRLYGRGSNDMKGGIAAILMAFRYLQDSGMTLKGDLLFESVVDEEMGGANGTLAGRVRGTVADAAIIPEPTNLRVCTSHVGGTIWRIEVKGKGGMGFGSEEIQNPIYGMAHIVRAIEQYHLALKPRKPYVNPDGTSLSPGVVLSIINSGDFEPGMADGIPESCFIEVWVECHPGEDLQALEKDFVGQLFAEISRTESLKALDIEIERIIRFLPGSEASTPLAGILAGLASEIGGIVPGEYRAPFACDAFMFNLHSGTPAVILGPTGENAHAGDEFVELESVSALISIYIKAIVDWCNQGTSITR
jgi:acetylornithine deacetylase